jgi:hypothetical protein
VVFFLTPIKEEGGTSLLKAKMDMAFNPLKPPPPNRTTTNVTPDGQLLATASSKGTLVLVFNTVN